MMEKASMLPFDAFTYPAKVETPLRVPVFARTFLYALQVFIVVLMVPSTPAIGRDS